jgi:hypothetical protein
MPISVEKMNSSRLHPSKRHGNMSGRSSEFEKIAFLHRHGVGRQLALVQLSGQHRPDAEILDKEIACIHSAFVRTTRQHHSDLFCYGNYVKTKYNHSDSRAIPSGGSLNIETREAHYGKLVA